MPPSKNIAFEELSQYFHLPINDVAKKLGVCATILKKICRRNRIPRWPHRKLKSLEKMIANLEANLTKNPADAQEIAQEIEILRAKRKEILRKPDLLGHADFTIGLQRGQSLLDGTALTTLAHATPDVVPYPAYPPAATDAGMLEAAALGADPADAKSMHLLSVAAAAEYYYSRGLNVPRVPEPAMLERTPAASNGRLHSAAASLASSAAARAPLTPSSPPAGAAAALAAAAEFGQHRQPATAVAGASPARGAAAQVPPGVDLCQLILANGSKAPGARQTNPFAMPPRPGCIELPTPVPDPNFQREYRPSNFSIQTLDFANQLPTFRHPPSRAAVPAAVALPPVEPELQPPPPYDFHFNQHSVHFSPM